MVKPGVLHVVVMLVESLHAAIAASRTIRAAGAAPRPLRFRVPMKNPDPLSTIDLGAWEGEAFCYTCTQGFSSYGQWVDHFVIEVLGSPDRSRYRPTHESFRGELSPLSDRFFGTRAV